MFGHGALDIKVFNATSFHAEPELSELEKVIGTPPTLDQYYDDYDPETGEYTRDDATDRLFDLAQQQYNSRESQAANYFELSQYTDAHELRWCHNLEKYGTKLHYWIYAEDGTSSQNGSLESSALTHDQILGMMNITNNLLTETTVREIDCQEEGMTPKESFDTGGFGGFGNLFGNNSQNNSNSSNEYPSKSVGKVTGVAVLLVLLGTSWKAYKLYRGA
jgi:hypothetical protein